jgi:SdrD B-like domain
MSRSRNLGYRTRVALVEPLEARRLLSASMTALPLDGTIPPGSASPVGLTPAQIKSAYGINSVMFGSVVGDGTGQTIAVINAFDNPNLVDLGDPSFDASDLHMFDQQFGLPDPPAFTKVDQTGGTSFPGTDPSWANESSMDVEWVHAMAPKAAILLVEANSAGLDDLIGATQGGEGMGAVQYARTVPGVSVISMSFAASEAGFETSYDQYFTTPAGHTGITFVAGSGDDGAPGGYPAFSPNVVAVGATTLTLSGSNYGSETGYIDSGGGTSLYEGKPSFQDDVSTPSTSLRTIPDVAFNGDVNTGVAVYDIFNGGTSTPWFKVGGTSFSAPAWGGLIAVADQGRAQAGLGTLDGPTQTLPRLYEVNAADFNDITTGSNGFGASVGYDLVTGRGTPKANLLLPDLAGDASISGNIFNDINANGADDSGEPSLAGWTVFIDFNHSGTLGSNDISAVTDSNGNYTLSDVPGGTFTIDQQIQAGWRQTLPSSGGHSVAVTFGQTVTEENFADQQEGSITGLMFNDLNGDGVREISEPALVDWTASITPGNIQATTSSKGVYSFSNLQPGVTYTIVQTTPSGWRQTLPQSSPITITLKPGEAITGVNFASTTTVSSGAVSSGLLPTVTAVAAAPPPKRVVLAVNTSGPFAASGVPIGFAEQETQPGNLADWSTASLSDSGRAIAATEQQSGGAEHYSSRAGWFGDPLNNING